MKCRQTYLNAPLNAPFFLNSDELLEKMRKYIPLNKDETTDNYLARMKRINAFITTYDLANNDQKPPIPEDLNINNDIQIDFFLNQAAQAKPFYEAYEQFIQPNPETDFTLSFERQAIVGKLKQQIPQH